MFKGIDHGHDGPLSELSARPLHWHFLYTYIPVALLSRNVYTRPNETVLDFPLNVLWIFSYGSLKYLSKYLSKY